MSLTDKKIIVTGGPTREWLDPVRFLSNPSTGKMGAAIADAAFEKSNNVVFIHGSIDSSLVEKKKYRSVSVETTDDMLNAVLTELEDNSILVMAAAPADYTAKSISKEKMKKTGDNLTIEMKRTPDILKNVYDYGKTNNLNIFTVGFAAETNDVENYAKGKLISKKLNMICLNDVSAEGTGFAVDTNSIIIFKKNGDKIEFPILSKKETAINIIGEIIKDLDSI